MKTKKIFLLHGEDAVNEYIENGTKGCIKGGYNVVSEIPCDGTDSIEYIIRRVLEASSGSLNSCLITEKEYEKIKDAFN